MPRKKPNYTIVAITLKNITIRDEGPWDIFPTITNGAEDVVEDLIMRGLLQNGIKLLYYDSEGGLEQLLHWNGKFITYAVSTHQPIITNMSSHYGKKRP